MKLHDRIIAIEHHIKIRDVVKSARHPESVIDEAAQIATEADKLMAELSDAAQNMLDVMDGKGGTKPNAPELLRSALKRYWEWIE